MRGAGRKISGALKRMTRLGSSHSQDESSSHHPPEPAPTPTTMDYEQDEQEEQFEEQAAEPQAEDMEIDEMMHHTSTCKMTASIKTMP